MTPEWVLNECSMSFCRSSTTIQIQLRMGSDSALQGRKKDQKKQWSGMLRMGGQIDAIPFLGSSFASPKVALAKPKVCILSKASLNIAFGFHLRGTRKLQAHVKNCCFCVGPSSLLCVGSIWTERESFFRALVL